MSLLALKHYLIQVKTTSLGSLCTRFNLESDTLRAMLMHWIAKGKIELCKKEPACGSRCFKCPAIYTEIVTWVG